MKWFKIFFVLLFSLFILCVAALEFLPVQSILIHALKKSGMNIEQSPDFVRVEIAGQIITIEKLHIEISYWHLFKKELFIKSLTAGRVQFQNTTAEKISSTPTPIAITVHSFAISHLQWPDSPELEVYGSGRLGKHGAIIELEVHRPDFPDARLSATIARELNGTLDARFDLYAPPGSLDPWFQIDHLLELSASGRGQRDAFAGKLNGIFNDWIFRGKIHKQKGGPVQFTNALASKQNIRLQGSLELNDAYEFAKAEGQVRADLEIGLILGTVAVEGSHVKGSWHSANLKYDGIVVEKASGQVEGIWERDAFEGCMTGRGEWLQETWELQTTVAWPSLAFEELELESGLVKASGNFTPLAFKLDIERGDLQLIQRWNPKIPISGKVTGTISNEGAELTGKEIFYDTAYIENASFTGNLDKFKLSIDDGHYKRVTANTGTLEFAKPNFHLVVDELDVAGTYHPGQLVLEEGTGVFFKERIRLVEPTLITPTSWTPIFVTFGNGTIYCAMDRLIMTQVPLTILSLNPLEVPISGTLNADGRYDGKTGNLTASINSGQVVIEGTPIRIEATLDSTLEQERLKAKTHVVVNDNPLLDLDIDYQKSSPYAHLVLNGKVEDVLDFFNLGMHRFEGNCACDLTLNESHVEGFCEITEGHYQNYLTGTELNDIHASIVGEDNRLVLKSLTSRETFTATGNLQVIEQFPFHLDLAFSDFGLVQIDLVTAKATGRLAVDGDIKSALAKGSIEVTKADIALPNKTPRSFPELQVLYKNGPIPKTAVQSTQLPYPLNLELQVGAPNHIFIAGKGLTSEWKGDFDIGGTFTAPATTGKLELLTGEFVVVGKQFKLLDGSLSMRGKPYEMPHIDIAANTQEKNISITARLQGPLNKPQITFQSNPPLPLSRIISYLIFGKDLSDVSGLQALQLAGTITSMAGEGPDILEMTRKSLGVDRLQILMTPSSLNEGAETISLEVGKVIFPGFLVTIRQGAEDSSPDIGIEVDITHGFTLGFESQQQPEQGRFSLNWNLNY